MRKIFLLTTILLFSIPAYGQYPVSYRVRSGTALPATCLNNVSVVDQFYLRSGVAANDGIYTCNTNQTTWDKGGLAVSPITGTGTTNTIPIWTASATLGNSPLVVDVDQITSSKRLLAGLTTTTNSGGYSAIRAQAQDTSDTPDTGNRAAINGVSSDLDVSGDNQWTRGFYSNVGAHGDNGTAYGFYASSYNDSSIGGDAYGYYANVTGNGIGTSYGLFVSATGGVTNYGIWVNAGKSYFGGGVEMGGASISGLGTPSNSGDATTKAYVDAHIASAAQGGFGSNISAQSGVPLFASGTPTFTSTSGTGDFARVTSPSLTTPTLGVASAISINKVTITAPASSSTLTIADGKVATFSNTLTFTGTDSSSVAFGAGGTVLYSGGALGTPSSATLTNATGLPISTGVSGLGTGVATFLATPSSANFASATTDESGSGSLIFGTSPTISTPRISQVIGGTAAGSALNLQSTTNASASGDSIVFKVGNNGGTTAGTITGAGAANLKWAGTATRGTTEGTNHLDIFDGTAPVGTLTNGISLYSTSGELRVMDAAGNATLLSPHDHLTNEWIFYSVNSVTGKVIRIDMERMMRELDRRLGGGYVHDGNDANALTTSSAPKSATTTLASLPSSIGGTQLLTPTPGSTITLTIDSTAKHIVASWTSGEAETINVSGTPQDGTIMTLIVTNDASLGRLLTMGSGMSALTTVLNVISKKSTISFVALNGTFYETSRTVGF